MNGISDPPMGIALWWLGLAIAICMGTLFLIPYPFGLVAIGAIFGLVGYMIPQRIIANRWANPIPKKTRAEIMNASM